MRVLGIMSSLLNTINIISQLTTGRARRAIVFSLGEISLDQMTLYTCVLVRLDGISKFPVIEHPDSAQDRKVPTKLTCMTPQATPRSQSFRCSLLHRVIHLFLKTFDRDRPCRRTTVWKKWARGPGRRPLAPPNICRSIRR